MDSSRTKIASGESLEIVKLAKFPPPSRGTFSSDLLQEKRVVKIIKTS
jgi:hypothetical protein